MRNCGRRLCIAGLVLAAGASGARADDGTRDYRFGLYLESDYFSYITSLGGEVVDDRSAVTAQPRLDWSFSPDIRMHAAVTARKDFSEEYRTDTYAYEAYVRVERERWSLSLGREVMSWGRADSLRPTDVFKRHDYTDLIENRVEGTDVVRASWNLGTGTLEGVWAPILTADIVSYAPQNRWLVVPRQVTVPILGTFDLTFREDLHQNPPNTFSASQVGIRWSATTGAWDYAGMAYYGYDRVPTFATVRLDELNIRARTATLLLDTVHERIGVVGADFARAIGSWTARGEAAYTHTADPDPRMTGTNEPYYRFTGGMDRSISSRGGSQSLFVSLQYAFDSEPEQELPPLQRNINPLLHPFRHAFVVNSIWKFTEDVQFNLKGYINIVDEDFALQPEIAWRPIDAMSVVLGGDVIGGGTSTFLGGYRDNDRVRLRIAYTF